VVPEAQPKQKSVDISCTSILDCLWPYRLKHFI